VINVQQSQMTKHAHGHWVLQAVAEVELLLCPEEHRHLTAAEAEQHHHPKHTAQSPAGLQPLNSLTLVVSSFMQERDGLSLVCGKQINHYMALFK